MDLGKTEHEHGLSHGLRGNSVLGGCFSHFRNSSCSNEDTADCFPPMSACAFPFSWFQLSGVHGQLTLAPNQANRMRPLHL